MFEDVPETIHRNDPYFVPPFPGSISKIFSPKSYFKNHGELLPFVALKDGKPVGRIAAIVNRSHNKYRQDKVGFFGYFDFIDDPEVSSALFQKAQSELKARGLESARGPYNPSINDECGLLVDGFEASPFVMMTYNPSYYLKHYEALGLARARDLAAYYISGAETSPERIAKISNRVRRSTGVNVRSVNLKHLKDELRIIQQLYNVTLDRNWGFIPIQYSDLEAAAADLKAIVNPDMVLIAEKEGKPVGFSLTIPNINEFMAKTRHSNKLVRALKFIWYLKTSHPKEARLTVLGVIPEFRNKGLAALFYNEALMQGRKVYIGGELGWIDEDNEEIVHGMTVMGAKKYKSYRIYEKPLPV